MDYILKLTNKKQCTIVIDDNYKFLYLSYDYPNPGIEKLDVDTYYTELFRDIYLQAIELLSAFDALATNLGESILEITPNIERDDNIII